MFSFLKNLFKKKGLSKSEIEELKRSVEVQISKVRGNPKVVKLEIDLKKKATEKMVELILAQMEKEYSQKLGRPVSISTKNPA